MESTTVSLREARQRAGLTQEQLAAAAEVDQSTISMLETGARRPAYATAKRLVKALQAAGVIVTDEDLFPVEKVS